MKQSYEVTILNQKFVLKTENDEAHVKRVADFVNKIFNDIKDRAQNVSTQNVAILGALNIAEQMLMGEAQTKAQISDWKSRLEKLLSPEN